MVKTRDKAGNTEEAEENLCGFDVSTLRKVPAC